MEKKSQNSFVCRHNRRRETVGDASRMGRHDRNVPGKVGQMMKIVVTTTTGSQLEVCVSPSETVRGLKQLLARKYRIAPARIHLLHRERVLRDGTLRDNLVTPGSRLVLCPNMESGTSPSREEHSVIQALKNLSQSQIHDFLSGRAPLTLAIRLGEHLMFVQLQLSTTSPSAPRSLSLNPPPSSSTPSSGPNTPRVTPPPPPQPQPQPSTSTASSSSSSIPPPPLPLSSTIRSANDRTPPPPAHLLPHLPPSPLSLSSLPNPTPTPIPTTTTTPVVPSPESRPRSHPQPQSGGQGQVSGSVQPPAVDPETLLQASQNLTQKLKELTQLTQQALQARAGRTPGVPSMPLTPPPSPPPSPGAVIDSMQHVGRGVYSGTFSGTLDPRLQDVSGHPRRDVNTILHILHDLLLARPSTNLTPSPSTQLTPPSTPTPTPTPSSVPPTSMQQQPKAAPAPAYSYPSPAPATSPSTPQLPPSPRSPTLGEHAMMRAKVMRVQRMLAQRRALRQARRRSQRPYPSTSSSSSTASATTLLSSTHHHHHLSTTQPTSFPFPPTSDASGNGTAAAAGEAVDTTNYRKPSMEQETVAV